MLEIAATGTTNTGAGSLIVKHDERLAKPWKVSDKGIAFIGVQESGLLNGMNFQRNKVVDGMILKVYLDSRQLPTVGMGHLVVLEDNLKVGDAITIERARDMARKDLYIAESSVNKRTVVPLYQHEYDCLVSLVFNCGQKYTLEIVSLINSGNYLAMPNFIEEYRASHGNTRRRKQEAAMFKSGNYDTTH